jgi:hypothetical protein
MDSQDTARKHRKSVAANTERTSNKNEHWVDNMDAYL